MANFFGPSCVPGIQKNESGNLWKQCQSDFEGEMGALHCLSSGVGDVAFVSSNSINQFKNSKYLPAAWSFASFQQYFVFTNSSLGILAQKNKVLKKDIITSMFLLHIDKDALISQYGRIIYQKANQSIFSVQIFRKYQNSTSFVHLNE